MMAAFPKKLAVLQDRAAMLAKARDFFHKRGVLEVDCPIMSPFASVDVHIDLIRASGASAVTHYLHSSPEYGMKKLLAEGISDIYQISHVFRDDESSPMHNPEFTMVEWYRTNMPFAAMIEETVAFVQEFVGDLPFSTISYREAFKQYAGIDYFHATEEELGHFLKQRGIDPYQNLEEEGKDALLNIILGVIIQPKLGEGEITVLQHYPASQAMLSQTCAIEEEIVSERFEVFFQGIELANGYHELTDHKEQLERLLQNNNTRERLGKNPLPVDHSFIRALEKGLPDCCGVAVGFDRLMMIRHRIGDIAGVLPVTER